MITLFKHKKDCCGCGACASICTKTAITMVEDEYGFVYPQIDEAKCVDCGACLKVCAFQNRQEETVLQNVYAAASKDKHTLMHSASGGIFAEAAKIIIDKGGVVYGATMWRENDRFIIRHKRIEKKTDIGLLQGSKYVQSDMGDVYKEIRRDLMTDRFVLFSGTPCQCASLKTFLRKQYDKLIVMDLVCHGVPSQKFFNDYINYKFAKCPKIHDFKFRDKTKGWGMIARLDYANTYRIIYGRLSSYVTLFIDGHTYRENCYHCKYASSNRIGDITIGDYWGFQYEHPERKQLYDVKKGVSCIIVNTELGEIFMDEMKEVLTYNISSFDKVAKKNEQLTSPSKVGKYRLQVMDLYKENGYKSVDDFYKVVYRKQIILHTIYNMLPYNVKMWVKRIKD